MMKPITHYLIVVGLFLCGQSISAQITTTFSPATTSVQAGQPVTVQLRVTGFTNIATAQMTIAFNKDLLQFDSLSQSILPGWNAGLINPTSNANAEGKVKIAWFADQIQFPNGFTTAANSALFTLHFKGLAGGSTTINLTNASPGTEIVNASFVPVPVNFTNGAASVNITGAPVPLVGFKLIANQLDIPQGTVGCMPVNVNDFDNIVALTYSMGYNPAILEYTTTQAHNLPALTANSFVPSVFVPGNILTEWQDPTALGVSRPDNAQLYTACFRAIGAPGTCSSVSFAFIGAPPSAGNIPEAINANSQNVWTTPISANVCVVQNTPPVILTADKDTIPRNQQTCVDVKVQNFKDISVAQFGLTFDPASLSYQSIQLGSNPLGLALGTNFTTTGAASGNLAFTWTDATPPLGVTLADNATLFSVCFNAIGQANTQSAITFANVGNTLIEMVHEPGGVTIAPTLNNGQVRILDALVPTISLNAVSPTCPGGNNGSVTSTVQNCPGATYAWNVPGQTSPNLSNVTAGIYTLTCTCSGGVTATASTQVQSKQPITLSQSVTTPTCVGGSNGSISITPNGGTAPYSGYQWTKLGGGSAGTQKDATGLNAGSYTVTFQDANNCPFTSSPISVNNPPAINANPATVNPSCASGNGAFSGSISLSPANGQAPYKNFSWSGPSSYQSTQQNITSLGAGQYTVTFSDNNNCTASATVTLAAPPAITAAPALANPTCPGTTTGSITLTPGGGNAPYTYAWNGPAGYTSANQNITGLAAGAYNLTVTDNNSCTASFGPFNLSVPAAMMPSVVTANVKCFGANDGTINLSVANGTPPYTYNWNIPSTVEDPQGLAPGQYTVTVRDANNCTVTLSAPATIQGPSSAVTITESINSPNCPGGTGSISVSASGGWGNFNYNWSNSLPQGPNQNGLQAGNYSVTISDAGGCSSVKSYSISTPPQIASSPAPQVNNPTCSGTNNGSITISPSGGTGPYSVMWNNGNAGTTISALPPGDYTPTITDAMGCTAMLTPQTITLTAPPAIVIAETVTPVGPGNGSVSLNVSLDNGATGNFTYTWSGTGIVSGNGTNAITVSAPGSYAVTIVEASQPNCPQERTFTVSTNNVLPLAQLAGTNPSCSNDGCVNIVLPQGMPLPFTVTVGTQTFPVNNFTDTLTLCGLAAGTYSVTLAGGGFTHTFNSPAIVAQNAMPAFGYSSSSPTDGLSNGSITIESNNPGVLAYNWSVNNATTPTVSGLDKGTYTVTVTHTGSGCTVVETISLDYLPALVNAAASNITHPNCQGTSTGSIVLNITGGDYPLSYQWSGPGGFTSTQKDPQGLAEGTYTVTITEADGVVAPPFSFTLTDQSNLASNVTILSNYGQYQTTGACDGIATVSFSGQAPGMVNVLWSNNVITNTNTMLCGGSFTVTVTDGQGCTAVSSGALTAPPALTSQILVDTLLFNGYAISCNGECDAEGGVRITGGIPPYRIEWPTGPIETVQQSGGISSRVNLCAGDYFVTVTDRGGQGVAQIAQIKITEPAEITADFAFIAPETFRTCDGEIVIELSGAVGSVDYAWVSDFGRNGDTLRATNLCPNEVVTFIVVDENGCRRQFSQQVPFPPDGCFQVSPVLTPGELDGKNDWVEITCITESPDNTVEIYNRWGQLVYSAKGYDNGATRWDGLSSNGEPLAAGVYFYVVTYSDIDTDEPRQIKGHINLLR